MTQGEEAILEGILQRYFLIGGKLIRYISIRLDKLIYTLGNNGTTLNSIRYTSSTELPEDGFDERTINVFTHHTPDSKMNQEYQIFVVNREQESVASTLINNHEEKLVTLIISKKWAEQEYPKEMYYRNLLEPPNDHKSVKRKKLKIQKDDQDVEPLKDAKDSSMKKDSDRTTTAEAQKQ
ncbi:MAG: hypothetical protein EZS28_007764 [Streblomastix strix]|uniref:Uncharacterized protein n=1 Tax=Streblomastix strix TaxID=222440 RepID=A0A5J4WP60_9EUKA|nr:MAG: hypothetical protein EZS28_007764 [Streblomastix strix]